MRILTTLTYYTPHISGLTVYATRVIQGLIKRGHQVTVVTSHYDKDLPLREQIDGAEVIRCPVSFRFGKGVLMPTFVWRVARLMREHDLLYLHLPQFEAAMVAGYTRYLARKPVVTSYQCDIELPDNFSRRIFGRIIDLSHHLTAASSHQIVATSMDYAENSSFLRRHQRKVLAVYPPCPDSQPEDREPFDLRREFDLGDGPIVSYLGRFAEDKGVQHLIDAAPEVLRTFPEARFVLAGQREKVFGERVFERLLPSINALGDRLIFPGQLPQAQLAGFLSQSDVLVLPSVNSTESFGMVQVEAMLCGTPVVASNLPGVRVPVRTTGMGELATPGDAASVASSIVKVLSNRTQYVKSHDAITNVFNATKTVDFYEQLFTNLIEHRGGATPARK